jgi:hypothetical protein
LHGRLIRGMLLHVSAPVWSLCRADLGGLMHQLILQHACGSVSTKDEWVIEGISLAERRKPLQLDVECCYLWDQEWRQ